MMSLRALSVMAALLLTASWALAADVFVEDFNGAYPFTGDMIEEDWERAFFNGTWWIEEDEVTSPPKAQLFATYVGDTCRFCVSAIWYHGQHLFYIRDFAPDIDAANPWSLTCNVFGHNDTKRPDHFVQYWSCQFDIQDFSNALSKEYGQVYWTSENDRTWEQITFNTAGSTSGDDLVSLILVPGWGYAVPVVDSSFVVFDDVWLTYTPDNGDVSPPGQVIGLAADRGDGQIELTWQNPSDADFAGTLIRVRTGHFPVSKRDGDLVVNLPGSPGAEESFVHQPTDNGTSYYYAAYTYDDRTSGPNPDASYANYSQAATVAVLAPPTPTVDADIGLVESLGWDVVNHGDAASPNFDDSVPPTAWDTTTPTPSGDNRSAEINTVGLAVNRKWRESSDLSSTSGVSMFLVWKPREGMSCGPAGVWGSSAYTVFEARTASVKLNINADAAVSWPPGNLEEALPVPEGLAEIGLNDAVDPPGGLGTQFDTFTIETEKWQRWWFQVDASRNFKLYDLNDVVPGEGPHLLASGQLGVYTTTDSRITIGDGSGTAGIDSDFLVDEVYVLDSFRDVSAVQFPYGADFDGDGDVDLDDYDTYLVPCYTGPGGQTSQQCERCDLDEDNDVDLIDFATFQCSFTGSGS